MKLVLTGTRYLKIICIIIAAEFIFACQKLRDLDMPEELFLNIRFKNRKTGEIKDGYVKVPDLTKYANGLKRFFDVHEFRICEKRLVSKDEFENKGRC